MLIPSNDPEYPQPGVGLAVMGVCAGMALVVPAVLVLYLVEVHRTFPAAVWKAAPMGLVFALWPNVQAWRRRDMRSAEIAVAASRICAALSGVVALTLFYFEVSDTAFDISKLVTTNFSWVHATVAAVLAGNAYFMEGWRCRIQKYRSRVRLCPQCNYDLSATIADRIERCPECGRAVPVAKWEIAALVEKAFGRRPWGESGSR